MLTSNKASQILAQIQDPLTIGPMLALGRWAYGNSAGLKQNLYGNYELRQSRSRGPFSHLVKSNAIANEIDTVGYMKAPWRYPAELMDHLAARLDDFEAQHNDKVDKNEANAKIRFSIENALEWAPKIHDVFNDELEETAHSYFGSHVKIYKPDLFRIFHVRDDDVASKERFSDRWHCDSGKTSILSILILISDVTENHGATWCKDRQKTRSVMRDNYVNRDTYALSNSDDRAENGTTRFTGKKGEAWIINTRRTLHRAGIPKEGLSRDILGLKMTPIPGNQDVWDESLSVEDKCLFRHNYS